MLALGRQDSRTTWRRRRFVSGGMPRSLLTVNGPTLRRPYYYSLDGGDYFTSPNTSDWNITTGDYTWVIVMRPASVSADQNILGKRKEAGGTDGYAAGILSTGYARLVHHDTGTTGYSYRDTADKLTAGADVALAFQRSGSTLHLFINGAASEGTQTNSGTVTTLTTSTAFAISDVLVGTWGRLANGSRIYGAHLAPAALSAAEIKVIGDAIKARSRFAWA